MFSSWWDYFSFFFFFFFFQAEDGIRDDLVTGVQTCALPISSLLVTYGTAGDLFFSGHTAIAVYGCVELVRLGGPVLPALGVAIAIVEALTVLVLRAHYTMDVLAAIVAALWAADVASAAAPAAARALAALVGG